jgi:hypothetical protein
MIRLFYALSILLIPLILNATPAEVLVIRHAEKPAGAEGTHLSARGLERAQALVQFFTTDPRMIEFGQPVAVFAGSPTKSDGSVRPIETAQPLADKLGLQLRKEFTSADFESMTSAVLQNPMYSGKTVVIVWSRAEIPDLVGRMGVTNYPSEWTSDIYDRVWKIRFNGNVAISFENLPQHLLSGDSEE